MGFAIAGRVGVAKKYLECHEGFAEDGYNESGEKEKICGYVELTSFPSCEATWVVGEEKMLRNLAALCVVSFIVRRISKSCGRGKFQ